MIRWLGLFGLLAVLGVFLSSLHAVATTLTFVVYDIAARRTTTTLGRHDAIRSESERARTACDDAIFAYDDSWTQPTAAALRGVLAYDNALNVADQSLLDLRVGIADFWSYVADA
jgi:hypothetical protein